jgi:hypothetical protein
MKTIKREELHPDIEMIKEAEFVTMNPSEKFVEMVFKNIEIKYNDGTTKQILHYWGEQGGWHPSAFNLYTQEEKEKRLRKII